jgi:hypothetical protein
MAKIINIYKLEYNGEICHRFAGYNEEQVANKARNYLLNKRKDMSTDKEIKFTIIKTMNDHDCERYDFTGNQEKANINKVQNNMIPANIFSTHMKMVGNFRKNLIR